MVSRRRNASEMRHAVAARRAKWVYTSRAMPVRPEEAYANMLASLKEKTGRTLEEWRVLITEKGFAKHGEIMTYLKGEEGVSHGFANAIALNAKPGDAKAGDVDLEEAMFVKKEACRPIYDLLKAKIDAFGSDVDYGPKKAYMSVRRSKQFAILQPAAGRLDVGINLKGVEPAGRLEASGSFNAMVSHRVRVNSVKEVDEELIGHLRRAYEAA